MCDDEDRRAGLRLAACGVSLTMALYRYNRYNRYNQLA